MFTYRKNGKRSAFTLIEIMVATVIMVILVGLVIQITSEVLRVWNRSSGKLAANADARIALQLLTQDLETAVFRNDGLLWFEAEQKEMSGVAGYRPQTVNLIVFSPAADRSLVDDNGETIAGDICVVQYGLVYQDPVGGASGSKENESFALHRRVIDPSTTFNSLMGGSRQADFDSWKNQLVPAVDVALQPYEGITDPQNYLVGNVADFRLQFYVIDSDNEEVLIEEPSILYGGSLPTVGPFSAVASDYRYPLAYAELTITVISDEGAKLIRNLELGRGGTGYDNGDDIILQHGEVYKRRINFVRPL